MIRATSLASVSRDADNASATAAPLDAATPGEMTGIADAISMALHSYPGIRAVGATVSAQEANVDQARYGHWPTVGYQATRQMTSDDPLNLPTGFNGSPVMKLNLYAGGSIDATIRAQRSRLEEVKYQVKSEQDTTALNVAQAYIDWFRASESLRYAIENEQRHEKLANGGGLNDIHGRVSPTLVMHNLELNGFFAKYARRALESLTPELLPAILLKKDGSALVVVSVDVDSNKAAVLLPESGMGEIKLSVEKLAEDYGGVCVMVKPRIDKLDRGLVASIESRTAWLWKLLLRYRSYYWQAAVATVIVNLLTMASAFFTMIVYDRVVPNRAYETLWVLVVGVVLSMLLEFILRNLRAWLLDIGGKKVDLLISSNLFQRTMSLRLDSKPGSAGAYASNLRDFESLRDFFTSAALTTIADMPFVILFVAMICMIGGWLAVVPLLAIPIVGCVALLSQIPLAHYTRLSMSQAGERNGVLVEAVDGLESVKSSGAQWWMQEKWNSANAFAATSSAKIRGITTGVMHLSMLIQQLSTVVIVAWGVYMIGNNTLSMGGLVGTVIGAGHYRRWQWWSGAIADTNHRCATPDSADQRGAFHGQWNRQPGACRSRDGQR
ncbi:ABC transporter transmembrane domain-containing protein [Paraburkholderia sp. DGU8]|uniref:ABC transporter transmembrane domain-containing protein n=1 Tax=Paraburkholderia sp. DGU8 TaxID=3161997 RepID=UPI0034657C1E